MNQENDLRENNDVRKDDKQVTRTSFLKDPCVRIHYVLYLTGYTRLKQLEGLGYLTWVFVITMIMYCTFHAARCIMSNVVDFVVISVAALPV